MDEKKELRRFNKALLDECIMRDGATLIGEYEKLSREAIINFICNCGENANKNLRMMEKNGTFCGKCACENKKKKVKKTCLERYGVEYPLQNKEVMNKVIKTNLEKYVCSSSLKNKEVREKVRNSNLEKYGVEYPQQNKQIRNKTVEIFKEKYGVANPSQKSEFQQKKIETNIKNLGVEWAPQSDLVKEKINKTNLMKYGVEHPQQNKVVQAKTQNTNLEKYGVINPMQNENCRKKSIETSNKKYGVDYPFQSEEVKLKQRTTMLEKYGVEYNMQCQEIQEKAQKTAKKYKEYKMPSGEIRKVQGYEPFALDALVKIYTEDQIKTDRKDVPRIQYEVESKKKYYFPDIFIPHENKLIEVKSSWTIKLEPEKIQAKSQACKAQGYNYEIWCYDRKGKRVDLEKDILSNHQESDTDLKQKL